MTEKTILAFSPTQRTVHWLHTIAFLVLLATGAVLYVPALAPLTIGEAGLALRFVHRVFAVLFMAVPVLYVIFDLKGFLYDMRLVFTWTKDDLAWLRAAPAYYFNGDDSKMPPQAKFNSGQKMFYLIIVIGFILFTLTGLVMWFGKGVVPPTVFQGSVFLHDLTTIATASFFAVHFFLATAHPLMKQSLDSMRFGRLSEEYVREHHGKWYEEIKTKGRLMNGMANYDTILIELQRQAENRPELAAMVAMYRDLIEAQARARMPAAHPAISAEEAAARLAQGRPLLSPEEIKLDPESFAELCRQTCTIAAEHRPELAEALTRIWAWLDANRQKYDALTVEFLREGRIQEGEEAGLDNGLLAFVLNSALHPFLRAQAAAVAPWIDDSGWYRGYCPVCGGDPDFAFLQKGPGARRLACRRCDTEWGYQRIGCPFCGNEDRASLGYYVGENEAYRLYVCEQCGGYLKTLDERLVAERRPTQVERVLTAGMDATALQMAQQ
jgi:formate dehydrogenase subunit gamma